MQSLRDKLLAAGLVTKEQATKAVEAAPKPPRQLPALPPLPGSKAHQRLASKQQLRLDRELLELVLANEVPLEPGDTTFYFATRKGKVRRLEISKAQADRLEAGDLAVVERPEPARLEHSLVPKETAERIHGLFPNAVRFFNRPQMPQAP
jgi:uncharacterized protein YaiL (DUF2058 family)